MLRLRGELQLAGMPEIAVDRMLGNDRLDAAHRAFVGAIELPCGFGADPCDERRVVLRDAGIALAAVAAGRFTRDLRGFEHDHRYAALRKRERRRQAGEAAADHGHIGAPFDGPFAAVTKRGTGIQPVRVEFHRILLKHSGDSDRRSPIENH